MDKAISPEDRKRIAAKVGVNEQYLYQCLTGRRDMNPGEARRVEKDSDGVITRQMVCQKTWMAIWPELGVNTPRKAKEARAQASPSDGPERRGMGRRWYDQHPGTGPDRRREGGRNA